MAYHCPRQRATGDRPLFVVRDNQPYASVSVKIIMKTGNENRVPDVINIDNFS